MAASLRRRVRPRLRLYVSGVAAGALLLLPLTYRADPSLGDARIAINAGLLAAMIAWANRRPLHIAPRRNLNVSTAPEVTAVLLLPPSMAALTLLAGTLLGESGSQVHPVQRLFNASAAVWRACLGAAVYLAVAGRGDSIALAPLAALLAAAAMYVIATILVRGVALAQSGRAVLRQGLIPDREIGASELALSLTGILAAQAASAAMWTLPMLLAPAAIAHRSVRNGLALREQTRLTQCALEQRRLALEAREQFLTSAAHELRTPLTSLRAYLGHARRRLGRGATIEAIDPLLAGSERQAARMSALVSGLLETPHPLAGDSPPDYTWLRPDLLAERCAARHRELAPDRPVRVTAAGSLPAVRGDSSRLELALMALLENAHRYSPPAEPVTVTLRREGEGVLISVHDQGIGVPEAERTRIFERLYRASNVPENVSGLGLGLSLAAGVIAAHSGVLRTAFPPGGGSIFSVYLPGAQGTAAPTTVATPRPA